MPLIISPFSFLQPQSRSSGGKRRWGRDEKCDDVCVYNAIHPTMISPESDEPVKNVDRSGSTLCSVGGTCIIRR